MTESEDTKDTPNPRILCIGETWLGSDARAAFFALRRLGASVHIIDEAHFVPTEWQTFAGRAVRKLFRGTMVSELTRRCIAMIDVLQPDALFVFKGNYVSCDVLDEARRRSILTVNYYPDVSFLAHGPQLPKALQRYDHVFNAKTFGIRDMTSHGVRSVSFLAPGFDPEVHFPRKLSDSDIRRFGCDVSFIGTWSPKKEKVLAQLRLAIPQLRLKVWGNQWDTAKGGALGTAIMGTGITGDDYAIAICGSSICLGILSEARLGSSSGDLITARTFQIPACGTFMLHERTTEVEEYFAEGREAEFYAGADELIQKVKQYLDAPVSRAAVARGGLRRSIESGYSIDHRMRVVLEWMRLHSA